MLTPLCQAFLAMGTLRYVEKADFFVSKLAALPSKFDFTRVVMMSSRGAQFYDQIASHIPKDVRGVVYCQLKIK